MGCLRFAFPLACRGKGLPRDSAGLRGWGAHGALQGPEGLRGALQGFRRCGITRDRPKWRFSTTGTRNMTFSIRVCALVMAFSLCLSRKRPSQVSPRRLKSALGLPRLRTAPTWRASDTKKTLLIDRHAEYVILDSSLCACDGLFPLPVEEKAISWTWCAFAMAFSPCLSRKR